ncbi:MAG: MFS transporter [Syntrophales bacterium LBB04]|nr:MFS transporter [Syntrophales bacterium LBB04]
MSTRNFKARGFWPFFYTQFFGAFNDNVLKNALAILITYRAYSIGGISPEQMVSLCGGIFILPFFLFSAISGQLADKFSKPKLIRVVKALEIVIMSLGLFGLVHENIMLLLVALFLMGLHSTLFGPVKYSILPHILHSDELITGNAYVETGTFIAILLGSIFGVQGISMQGGTWVVGIAAITIAVLGFLLSLRIKPIEPVVSGLRLNLNPVSTTIEILSITRKVKSVFNSILGISWFWFIGIAMLSIVPVYCKDLLKANESVVTLFLVLFSIGIGAGSILCERLSFKRTELGLVPIGSLGISLFALDLFWAGQPSGFSSGGLMSITDFLSTSLGRRISLDIFFFAVSGGFFTVPLYTFIQQRSNKEIRSRVIAGNNILNALFMVAASIFLTVLYHYKLSFPQIFLILSLLNVLVAIYIYTLIPEFLLRLMAWGLSNIIYRLKVIGRENLPTEGPFVIACNHVTYMDSFVVASGCPRPARFVMYYKYFDMPLVNRIFRDSKVIPIAGALEEPAVLKAAFDKIAAELQDGEVVCIFPEGELTGDGKMHAFKSGIEKILQRTPVPVVPACLNGLWGSYFSRKYTGKERRPFRRKRSRISIEFGLPIAPEDVTSEKLFAAVGKMKVEEA